MVTMIIEISNRIEETEKETHSFYLRDLIKIASMLSYYNFINRKVHLIS